MEAPDTMSPDGTTSPGMGEVWPLGSASGRLAEAARSVGWGSSCA
jgi:hypothetical protein